MAKKKKHDPETIFQAFEHWDEEDTAWRLNDHQFTEYGFYQPVGRKERAWRFTCCGEDLRTTKGECLDVYCDDIHSYKHNDKTFCPLCGKNVVIKCLGRLRTNGEGCYDSLKESRNVCVLGNFDNGVTADCGVLWQEWQPGEASSWELQPWPEPVYDCWDKRRYFIAPGEVYAWINERVWNTSATNRWYIERQWRLKKAVCRRPFLPWSLYHYDQEDGMYSTINPHAIMDSDLRYSGMDHYFGDLWDGMFGYPTVAYLIEYAYHPQLEMLTKLGHDDVIEQLLHYRKRNTEVLNWKAKTPNEFFHLSKAGYRLFKEQRGKLADLEQLRQLDGMDMRTYFEIKRTGNFKADGIRACVSIAKRLGITLQRAANYAAKGNGVGLWKDYLDAAETLGLDLSREDVFMPKDLRARHDEAVALVSYQANDAARRNYQRTILPKLRKKYAFSMDGLSVIVPESEVEIITEGKVLEHCVGGYAERHLKGRTVILFLRHGDAPGESYVTIEMNENRIIQAHGFGNEWDGSMPPLVRHKAFFETWLHWLEKGSLRYTDGSPMMEQEVRTA